MGTLVGASVTVRFLGPPEVVVDGKTVDLGGARQRRLMIALTVERGAMVSADRLAERVWGDVGLPADPRRTLRTYLTRLRHALPDAGLIETHADGWRLDPSTLRVDADEFERLVSDAAEPGLDAHERLARLDQALALWRGPAFGDLAGEEWLRAEAERLEELRATALERRYEAMLAAGMHTDAVPGLAGDVEAHPWRDRLVGLQMLALFRSGRQAEATRVFQAHRRRLDEELGLEPGADLVELDRRIVAGDPSLHLAGPAGRPLRGYRLGEQLGEGAFAVVYRGVQPSVGRDVAVKVIRAELANRPEFVRRFEAEAHLVARLEHPYIVPLYDYWREPSRACLVFRYLRGGTLEAHLTSVGPLTVDQCRTMIQQVGAGLAAAHAAGVVHRDVKPANVFLDGAGNYYLGDFGIALEAAELTDATSALSAGSPAYASPEQLRREAIGPPADVHGLGISIYEALTGRLPFPSATTHAALLQHQLHDPIPSVREHRSDVPGGVDEVLARATCKEPTGRYQSVDELIADLEIALGDGAPIAAPRVGAAAAAPRLGAATAMPVEETRNPYKGLRAFTEADTSDFFGRERLVDRLVALLSQDGTVGRVAALVGPSGIGKSSVVWAGLLPAVRRGAVAGSDRWFVATMLPSRDPFEELAAALLRVATHVPEGMVGLLSEDHRGIARVVKALVPADGDTEVLLVVDQFEELFTLVDDEAVRRRFLDGLQHALADVRCPLRVILTMRADFWDRPLRHGSFARLIEQSTVNVTALAPDELERAIVEPAHRVGAEFEPGLVSEIVADVTDQPGALPLLQYALTELWERRVSNLLTRDAYRELGGVAGALARRAEELYQQSSADEQVAIRRVFGRLTTLGEGAEDTRRRVLRSELVASPDADVVITRYGEARLLSFDRDPATREPTVEVAHEALIRGWPRLRGWLDEDRDGIRILRHLTGAAAAWEASGRDDGELYRGGRLDAAEEWMAAHDADLTKGEREFLAASTTRRDVDQRRERQRTRRLRRLLAAVGVVAVVALIAGAIAVWQQREAADQRDRANVETFTAETARLANEGALRAPEERSMGLLLAIEAYERDPGPETLGALQRALIGVGPYAGTLAAGQRFDGARWLDDGTLLAAGPGGIARFDVATGTEEPLVAEAVYRQPTVNTSYQDQPLSVFTVAGDRVAYAPASEPSTVVVVDLATGGELTRVATDAPASEWMEFSPDGATLAAIAPTGRLSLIDVDEAAVRWSVEAIPEEEFRDFVLPDGATVFPTLATQKVHTWVWPLHFSPDGSRISVIPAAIRSYDADTGEKAAPDAVGRTADGVAEAMGTWQYLPSSDGERFLARSGTRFAVYETAGNLVLSEGFVEGAVNAPGGSVLTWVDWDGVSDNAWALLSDGRLVNFSLADGAAVKPFIDTRLLGAHHLAMSPDASTAAVTNNDGIALFALDDRGAIASALPRGETYGGSISLDGRWLLQEYPTLVALDPRADELYDAATGDQVPTPRDDPRFRFPLGSDLLVSEEGEPTDFEAAAADWLYTLRFFETGGADEVAAPVVLQNTGALDVDVSSDRRLVAVSAFFGGARIFDAATGDLVKHLEAAGDQASSIKFNADDSRLVVLDREGRPTVWSTADWSLVTDSMPGLADRLVAIRYSPDGRYLVSLDEAGRIGLSDPDTHELLRTFDSPSALSTTEGSLAFSLEGDQAIVRAGPSITLWDLGAGAPIGAAFPNERGNIVGLQDGEAAPRLVTAEGGARLVWNLDTSTWRDRACLLAGRNLTAEEWEEFGPQDAPYHATCEQWPSLA